MGSTIQALSAETRRRAQRVMKKARQKIRAGTSGGDLPKVERWKPPSPDWTKTPWMRELLEPESPQESSPTRRTAPKKKPKKRSRAK